MRVVAPVGLVPIEVFLLNLNFAAEMSEVVGGYFGGGPTMKRVGRMM